MQRLSRIAEATTQLQSHTPPETVAYATLNSRQRENHNFQKVSAALADYGYVTLRLSDDWQGADFIAQHIDGQTFLRVQLKSRMGVARKYRHRGLLEYLLAERGIGHTVSWAANGEYTQPAPGKKELEFLHRYRL